VKSLKQAGNRKNYIDNIIVILIYAGIIVLWQFLYWLLAENLKIVKPYIFPNPLGVVSTLARLVRTGLLFTSILYSLKKMLLGYALALLIGILVGLSLNFRLVAKAMKPVILGFQTLPSICWVPFALLWFGLNESATIFVIIIGSTFSLGISVESAIKNVNPLYIRAASTMGASKRDIYLKIILPASVPEFVSGLKQGWSFAWRSLMAGEMTSSVMGLGYILQTGRDLLEINQVMAVMLIIVLFSVCVENLIFGRIEKNTRKKMGL
jgi:NitT/TauT family transport system permease protein